MDEAVLVAGLGNPGEEYERTRHNAGFLLVDRLRTAWAGGDWRVEPKFEARVATAWRSGTRCLLCQPVTYMNASGESVSALASYYRVAIPKVLVVVDDADLPLGSVRMRSEGSSGGHHGLESVERHLGTRGYARIRLGIGRRPESGRQIVGHVLGKFGKDEWQVFEKVLERAVQQVECWMVDGIAAAMTRFNGAVTAPES